MPRALSFSFSPALPTTQRSLCGGESSNGTIYFWTLHKIKIWNLSSNFDFGYFLELIGQGRQGKGIWQENELNFEPPYDLRTPVILKLILPALWEKIFSAILVPWQAENQTFFFLPDFSSRWFLNSCHWLNFIPQPRQPQQNLGLSILLSVNKRIMIVFWHTCTIKMAHYNNNNYSIIMIMIITIIINMIQKHKTVSNSRLCFKNK